MARLPLIAEVPEWETHLRHPTPLTPQSKQSTKEYYLNFPPSQVRQELRSAWVTYDSGGATLLDMPPVASLYIVCDIQFMAAIEDSSGIQSGVPIQCEPYELMGYVTFGVHINGIDAWNASYQYTSGGSTVGSGGWGILAKTYGVFNGIQPLYIKPGDRFSIAYKQLAAPLRTIAKIGYFAKLLVVDKNFLEKAGIVQL